MKRLTIRLVAGAVFLAAGAAQAQTCAAPLVFTMQPGDFGGGVLTGDTCAATNSFTLLCGGVDSIENDVIVSFRLVTPSVATTISLTPSTNWDPVMTVLNGACSPNSSCLFDSNTGGPGIAETLNVGGPDGVYYMHITAAPLSNPPCGAFTLARTGAPVALQQFSVE